jgi:shikimate kinase
LERLVLIGFMGSGKTALGAGLAARLGIDFIDLDDRIEAAAGMSARAVFTAEGEAEFRRRELQALQRLESTAPARCIIATGGGIVETPAAHAVLRALGCVVWLRADPEAGVARLGEASRLRPLLDGDWRSRWERRAPLYAALAECIVDTHPDDYETSLAALRKIWDGA